MKVNNTAAEKIIFSADSFLNQKEAMVDPTLFKLLILENARHDQGFLEPQEAASAPVYFSFTTLRTDGVVCMTLLVW